jgi:hypothetical protein
MKQHIIEKNGFPKPLGLIIILVAVMLTCFINLAFTSNQASEGITEEATIIEYADFQDNTITG